MIMSVMFQTALQDIAVGLSYFKNVNRFTEETVNRDFQIISYEIITVSD